MFETIINFFKKIGKHEPKETTNSKDKAKERLHLVLMQDRANVSADFLEMMKQEIIEVIKKYIEVEENAIDVRLTNEINEDGTTGAPSLYANIPILNIRNEMKKEVANKLKEEEKKENKENKEEQKEENKEEKKEKEPENKEGEKEETVQGEIETAEEVVEEDKGNKEDKEGVPKEEIKEEEKEPEEKPEEKEEQEEKKEETKKDNN